jgi:hypothetical protein
MPIATISSARVKAEGEEKSFRYEIKEVAFLLSAFFLINVVSAMFISLYK